MKTVQVSKKQATLLAGAQQKAQQLSVLAQEAQTQVLAILELVAEAAGVAPGDIVSVDSAAETITAREDKDKPPQPTADPFEPEHTPA